MSHRASEAVCDKYINDEQWRIGDGLTLIAAAVGIGVEGVRGILTPDHSHHGWTLPVLATVVVVKLVLSRRGQRLEVERDATSAVSDSWQHWTEALTSAGAFVGISLALFGGHGWETADDWASVGAAAVMGYNGLAILLSALRGWLDSRRGGLIVTAIRDAAKISGVLAVGDLFVRRSAGTHQVVVHVQTIPSASLSDAYGLGGRVKSAIQHAMPSVRHVLVHVEPYDPKHGDSTVSWQHWQFASVTRSH